MTTGNRRGLRHRMYRMRRKSYQTTSKTIFSILVYSLAREIEGEKRVIGLTWKWKSEQNSGSSKVCHKKEKGREGSGLTWTWKIQCKLWVKCQRRRREHMITCTSHSSRIIPEKYVSKGHLLATRPIWDRLFDEKDSLMKWRTHASRTRQLVLPWALMTHQTASSKHPEVGIQLGNISISSSIER